MHAYASHQFKPAGEAAWSQIWTWRPRTCEVQHQHSHRPRWPSVFPTWDGKAQNYWGATTNLRLLRPDLVYLLVDDISCIYLLLLVLCLVVAFWGSNNFEPHPDIIWISHLTRLNCWVFQMYLFGCQPVSGKSSWCYPSRQLLFFSVSRML